MMHSVLSLMLGVGYDPTRPCGQGILSPSNASTEGSPNTGSKRCPRCEETKPREEFGGRQRNGKWRRLAYCRPCHLEYHREWRRKRGHEVFAGYMRDARTRYPERTYARKVVAAGIFCGLLKRGECEVGGECSGKVEAHHEDYSKPLEIIWVCRHHHRPLDRARRARERAA